MGKMQSVDYESKWYMSLPLVFKDLEGGTMVAAKVDAEKN
jgi:hypothetical protein